MKTVLATLAAVTLVAACTPEGTPPQDPTTPTCGAGALQGLVGQPAAVLETMKFAGPVRILRPGMAVTMDYSAARLNIVIDAAERIERVECG
jgi:hypothetical protein